MTRREQLRVQMRVLKYDMRERLFDLANIAGPVFLVSGLVVASVKLWLWVLP